MPLFTLLQHKLEAQTGLHIGGGKTRETLQNRQEMRDLGDIFDDLRWYNRNDRRLSRLPLSNIVAYKLLLRY